MIKISNLSTQNIGLIVVDSIAMFYRLEISLSKDYSEVNRAMTQQLVSLLKLARENDIPVIVTSQVYANFENKNEVNMVGGDLVRYTSKCILELKKFNKFRKVIVKRHRSIPEGKMADFVIVDEGVAPKATITMDTSEENIVSNQDITTKKVDISNISTKGLYQHPNHQ